MAESTDEEFAEFRERFVQEFTENGFMVNPSTDWEKNIRFTIAKVKNTYYSSQVVVLSLRSPRSSMKPGDTQSIL